MEIWWNVQMEWNGMTNEGKSEWKEQIEKVNSKNILSRHC
jgi:hypothetical protein